MAELSSRVFEIVIRDSRVDCVDIFNDFKKFQNLRRLSIVRSNLRRLNVDCDVRRDAASNDDVKTDDVLESDRSASKGSVSSLHSLEVLDVSGNLLTR